jgi:cyclohexanone monooxygenase
MALGVLNRPKLPGIPGIEKFQGHTFHASRWDYGYTGGDADGNLTGLTGKRVGILGTGATAVQCVPHVGESAEQLYVFQRTPSSVDVKNNEPVDPEWAKSLKPGWHQERMDNFQILTAGGYQAEDLVNDGWTEIIRKLVVQLQKSDDPDLSPEAVAKNMELADFEKMEQIRARVDAVVEDEATAEALKPYYRQFCKRPCFHNEYLPTFNRENVTLVDTKGQGVERVTEKGVVVDGQEYELDCLIYASGFEVGTSYTQRGGYEVYGREGQTLTEKWEDGVRTMHGMYSHGFPNCFFIMSITQSGFTVNFTHMLGETGRHLAYVIKTAIDEDIRTLEVSEEAEAEWVETILRVSSTAGEFQQTCTPSYYNNEGKPGEVSRQNGFFFGEPMEFMNILADYRADGGLKGLERS